MSNDLKLYHSAASPNSRRVRIFLAEKGIAIPLAPVDLATGEQHSDAYSAINPRRVVPTLVLADGIATAASGIELVGRIAIRRFESPRWRVTPEPVIGPRLARTRWAPTRPAD